MYQSKQRDYGKPRVIELIVWYRRKQGNTQRKTGPFGSQSTQQYITLLWIVSATDFALARFVASFWEVPITKLR